ncbi:M23 family metallopeptidase [Actinacidiphila sp. ITFR-21]|uniref:M23 family metallopeptidase n=1 Tax=Actinacidiphila sp. ITFR-21 TaxID=3075199 RepID=UPI00288ACF34|nr:M23 family metallopeptidase [Streptomyces sp. ITFR-21]WNI16245.1 M23 family metallopeptidase [Streptomyces sp. ITFR-21]
MASNQPAYAPARPEAEPAREWDEFPAEFSGGLPARLTDSAGLPDRFPAGEPAARDPRGAPQPLPLPLPAAVPVPRQRNLSRGSAVLGMAAMAAVGAGGVATAVAAPDGAVTAPISVPDALPAAAAAPDAAAVAAQPAAEPQTPAQHAARVPDPGEALLNRVVGEATQAREAVARAEREAAERAAAEQAARAAAARKVREQAAAAKAAAEAKAKADAEAAAQAEADRLTRLAASYLKPVSCYTLTAGYGETDPWGNIHVGQDFDAPTGTPVHAVHGGTVSSAGWAGSYGYRVVVTLDDATEVWYCHLSTMVVTAGPVTTGDTIGRVGATGNVPNPHLHLEVRPGGGDAVDPLPWLGQHGVEV